jgi:hypothetical protein
MSFFSCWSLFDACVGAANETIGTILLEFCGHCALTGCLNSWGRDQSEREFHAHRPDTQREIDRVLGGLSFPW